MPTFSLLSVVHLFYLTCFHGGCTCQHLSVQYQFWAWLHHRENKWSCPELQYRFSLAWIISKGRGAISSHELDLVSYFLIYRMCSSPQGGVITTFIFHSKYFPVSDCLKPYAQFTIPSCFWPNLERTLYYWTNDVKNAARWRLMNRWRQNEVKSAARCKLLNR